MILISNPIEDFYIIFPNNEGGLILMGQERSFQKIWEFVLIPFLNSFLEKT